MAVGANTVGVSIDLVLLDAAGYVGRLILWDVPPLTQELAELLALPAVAALRAELGDDRVAGVEVWHLRDGTQVLVDAPTAAARLDDASRIVGTYVS